MSLRHWVVQGTGTPKDKNEVNRREVYECDGWVCDLEVMGTPSILWKDLLFCLLWIKKERGKDKTYIWVSVRWKAKNEIWEIYTTRIHWVPRGTGTPKDSDEVNRRDVSKCDGWVCVLEVIGIPWILSVILKGGDLGRVLPTFSFRVVKNVVCRKWNSPLVDSGRWTPEVGKKRSVSRWVCRIYSYTLGISEYEFVSCLFIMNQ